MTTFAETITRRFQANPRVRVFPFGLSGSTRQERISVAEDSSSTFGQPDGARRTIELVGAAEFLRTNQVDGIDLMKINIEGGEYELLDHLIAEGIVERISDIQVQFHEFVPNAAARMGRMQKELERTHTLTYSVPFVWENWRRR